MTATSVTSGPPISGIVLNSGDQLDVYSSGTASGTVVSGGASATVFTGGIDIGTVLSGGVEYVSSGGVTSATVVDYGGAERALSSGVASGTVVNSGGYLNAGTGGVTTGSIVSSGGYESVSSGGVASAATVEAGGVLVVLPGGHVSGTINAGGAVVSSGVLFLSGDNSFLSATPGPVSGITLSGSEGAYLLPGGSAISAVLTAGSYLDVWSGGSATATQANAGAEDVVLAGGIATGTVLGSGGYEYVSAGGVTSDTTVGSSGFQYVSSGGVASGTQVLSGGYENAGPGGLTTGTILSSGGYESVSSGGVASATTVETGATLLVLPGGEASGTINDGGEVISSGVALLSRYVFVSSGTGTVSGAVVSGILRQYVLPGGIAVSSLVSGGIQNVFSGGVASGSIVTDYGEEVILSGGIASGSLLSGYNSYEYVSSGGVDSGSVIDAGGYEYVSSGGLTTGSVIDGGYQYISSGGIASSTQISHGGVEVVLSGGITLETVVSSGGLERVYGGGIASGTEVLSGGALLLLSGATASGTVSAGGIVASAGVVVLSAGTVISAVNPTLSGAVISAAETAYVLPGGSNVSALITDGGSTIVEGVDSGSMLTSGGAETVSAGGSLIDLVVNSAGSYAGQTYSYEYVLAGGSTTGTVLNDNGYVYLEGGSTTGTIVNSGGIDAIYFGNDSATTINSGGYQYVEELGAVADETVINSAGHQFIEFGAVASGTIVNSGGIETVSSGGTASGTILEAGGILVLQAGAQASGTISSGGAVISAGEVVVLSAGTVVSSATGTLPGATVSAGEQELVEQGGTAVSSLIDSGGSATVLGVDSGSLISGGTEFISAGGSAVDLVANSAAGSAYQMQSYIEVFAGGSTSATVLNDNALENVEGGTTTGTVVNANAYQFVGQGTASAAIVNSGGNQYVYGGALASGTTLNSGGSQYVESAGSASATVVHAGASEYVSVGGTTFGTVISSGGIEIVSSGGTASGTTMMSGGTLLLLAGAHASGTISAGGAVISSGEVVVISGGTVISSGIGTLTGAVIGANEQELVQPGDSAVSSLITSGGSATIEGVASATSVDGGYQYVLAGGLDSGSDVTSNGEEYVSSGGAVIDLTLNSAGGSTFQAYSYDYVFSGARTTGTVLNGEGIEYIQGGTTTGTVVNASGREIVVQGVAIATVVNSGGEQFLSSGGTATGTQVNLGGALDLALLSYTQAGSATVDGNDILTVTEGGSTYTEQLAGSYAGDIFQRSEETYGSGTVLTLEAAPCYCPGTLIETERGEIPVEQLAIGDLLRTRSGALRPLRWIGRRSYSGRFAAGRADLLPICIRAGALADGVPRRDLWISPLHAMYVDETLIPASALINGVSVVQAEAVEQVAYIHLELETHDVIFAEGAESETFVDDDSRGMFHNAAEYHALYPDAPRLPARYCAPRQEDGEVVAAARRRIMARTAPAPQRRLRGYIDVVSRDRIEGWAQDEAAPSTPVWLQIRENGIVIGEVLADQYRADVAQAGIGTGRHAFSFTIPGGLAPELRHVIDVMLVDDSQSLTNSPRVLEPIGCANATEPGRGTEEVRRGYIDSATRHRITGWALDPRQPHEPVALQVLDGDVLIARVLANRYRRDLADAGIGDGRHAFEVQIPGGLAPQSQHVIRLRYERDGVAFSGPPVVIAPATGFDAALQAAVSQAVAGLEEAGERDRVLAFLAAQADRLLQQRAEAEGERDARLAHNLFRWRGEPAATQTAATRALVIDSEWPDAGRDAGSQAVLSHMRALQQLGYAVSFAAAEQMAEPEPAEALAQAGIACCRAPYYASVEEVLRRQAGCFDLVYLHRIATASRYLALTRRYCPQARVLFSVADLAHLRLARQAEVEDRPELLTESRRVRLAECSAAWSADAVLVHSPVEAALLRQMVPAAQVHVVPWEVPLRTPARAAGKRRGIAFIGNYGHSPNVDAARFLAEEIMPFVHRSNPAIECLLVGSRMPAAIRRLARPGIVAVGHVDDLDAVFDRVRLTVAPIRYGAGLKGKVLESFAAGLPCVMTPIAAEGIEFPPTLPARIGNTAAELAKHIIDLHEEESGTAAVIGPAFIRRAYGPQAVMAALRAAARQPIVGLAEAG